MKIEYDGKEFNTVERCADYISKSGVKTIKFLHDNLSEEEYPYSMAGLLEDVLCEDEWNREFLEITFKNYIYDLINEQVLGSKFPEVKLP